MNALLERHGQEIEDVLSKYPPDQRRSAVMPLLYITQRADGYVTRQDMDEIAEILSISPTDVASIVGFYSLYHDKPAGKYRIQICNDLPCALRGADEFLDGVCQNLKVQRGETTEDGLVTIEAVMCLAACDKAPMFQVQSFDNIAYHENQTVETTMALVESWRAEKKNE